MESTALYALFVVLELCELALFVFFAATIVMMALSMYLDVPFVPTRRAFFPAVADALTIGPRDHVFELGSGSGHLLIYLGRRTPSARFVGIERNPLLFLYSQVYKKICGSPSNVTFQRGNLFLADLSTATKIYGYLLPSVMDTLLPKLEKELTHARFASRAFQFAQKHPARVIELTKKPGGHGEHLIYVYEF
ncbi:MAG TPA: hypothetical protein VN495_00275 [Candidatus Paceibacterota bacterium]|nr:hypothetical protein [Candidatus Paceibacterota bacterium]